MTNKSQYLPANVSVFDTALVGNCCVAFTNYVFNTHIPLENGRYYNAGTGTDHTLDQVFILWLAKDFVL